MDKDTLSMYTFNGDLIFWFPTFDYWEDYLIVANVIKNEFHPERIEYHGTTDIIGYFIINNTYYQFNCVDMLGVEISVKEDLVLDRLDEHYHLINDIFKKSYEERNSHNCEF
ncbi:MAG: hypothetical protein ACI4WH_03315 [Oscillospiraceae bacterium]